MLATPRLVWLFDLDGTLIHTQGAAREAFADAVRTCLAADDDLADIPFAGRTDPLIVGDILRKHGRQWTDGEAHRFWRFVWDRVEVLLTPERGRLLPGVLDLLARLEEEPTWVRALLTGNMTEMARIKLRRFGLEGRFAFGAFGEEAQDRDALARLAVTRTWDRCRVPASRCIVVGDTEHDVACARAAGARSVAVATGPRRRDELEGLGADLVLDDLSDPRGLIEWARAIARDEVG